MLTSCGYRTGRKNAMKDILTAWEKTSDYLKEKLGNTAFETWIAPLKPKIHNDKDLVLSAPDNFFRDWVEKHYKTTLEEALKIYTTQEVLLQLDVHTPIDEPARKTIKEDIVPKIINETANCPGLNPRYTFENFIIGSSNRHAHAYSLAVAESPAKTYNPLFIYGRVGLGKTHLMQAICQYVYSKTNGKAKISYLTSEKFTNELIEAIQKHSTIQFRQKYRNTDVLVVDDIQFIAGKESTQEEFFHTFNALYDAHKQIIMSSDRPPKEISSLQDRLVSRFSWGLTTDIQPPDLETRIAILKKKIEREPVPVSDDVVYFIAQLIKTNIRELEGALIKTIAYSLLEEKPVSLVLAKDVLKDIIKEPKKLITVDFIQRCVSEEFSVSMQELKAKRRNKNIVQPRQVAMYLSRELTDLSLPEIGTFFGGKDHTTVLHSYNKIKKEIVIDEYLKNKVEKVINIIQ